jgi:hypothetical protein
MIKIYDKNSKKSEILQFDFQSDNDMKMPKRMLFYRCIIDFNHELPVKQIVFYIGYEPLRMPNFLREENLYYEYEIYDFRSLDAFSFLNSDSPEAVIFAILGNFKDEKPEVMIEKMLLRLNDLCTRKDELNKFAYQLHVLAGLRKFELIFNEKIKAMSLVLDIDIKNDPFYLDGKEDGKIEMIEQLLIESHSVDFIANISKKSKEFILSIQKKLIQEGKIILNKKK